ncbi:GntR family transcriptional regulator [Dactylosporangium sp. AC04546]|uniref:GntR family transcriptional regulator n=1 Tax=Dactylosporangium sp. AC04546 TaxID=2862460 RepID=UPI001EDE343F|nr:GntR family transcriptional regulator [Dactylosporangium sp. AC04546]WVK82297.1 GntR family transcriptional regulator [Dactylosporangium sp. AC04546]
MQSTAWGAYKGIREALRARLVGGEFQPGDALPSEAALVAEYGVARNTVRRALDQLAEEGLITTQPGRGRLVSAPNQQSQPAQPQYQRIAAELRAQIESGELAAGAKLPSESGLVALYGVARGTARQALAALQDLTVSVQGKGRFVKPR